jgi:Holliday junction resolvasome RuvABC ATP-dependent DNA helicase subunit
MNEVQIKNKINSLIVSIVEKSIKRFGITDEANVYAKEEIAKVIPKYLKELTMIGVQTTNI